MTDAEHLENVHKEGVVAGVRFCQSALRDAQEVCNPREKRGMKHALDVVAALYDRKDREQKQYFAQLNRTPDASPGEYQQVAALVCMDMDCLKDISEQNVSLEELKEHILHYWQLKEDATKDPAARNSRFQAAQALFNLPQLNQTPGVL